LVCCGYIAVEGILGLASGDKPETSWVGIALTAGTFVLEPPLGFAKRRLGRQLGSNATAGEGMQNLLCGWLAGAVFVGLVANTVVGWWWLDGVVALAIAAWAVPEGWHTWSGTAGSCTCADPTVVRKGASVAAPSCQTSRPS
jgi:divalent metal cation (Fe/Co/Zn/Cd) transporter